MNEKEAEFLHRLKDLLVEYNASIHWNFSDCSDLHGVTGAGIGISINRKEILEVQGMQMGAYEIKQELE